MYFRIDLLNALHGEDQDRLLEELREVWQLGHQDVSLMHGEEMCAFVVLDGFVRATDPKRGVWLIGPGEVLGLEEMFAGTTQDRTYQTVCRTTFLALSRSKLMDLIGGQDRLAFRLQAELARIAGMQAQQHLAQWVRKEEQ